MKYSTCCFLVGFVALMVFSCKGALEDYGDLQPLDETKAIVKVVIGSSYLGNPQMFVRANGIRITPNIYARQPYPGGGYNTYGNATNEFVLLNNGQTNFELCLPKAEDDGTDSLVLYQRNYDLASGGRYTILFADTGEFTQSVLLEEDLTIPDSGTFRYQFVHLIPNVESVDLYMGRFGSGITPVNHSSELDTLLISDVKYLGVTDSFIIRSGFRRTFKIRPHGAAVEESTVLARYGTSYFHTLDQKVLTMFSMGFAEATGTMQPYLSFSITR